MKMPFVSILIPTYNREKLIAESILSALSQNYGDFEVVVVDNASTDGTWEQIQRIASTDSRVQAFRNEANVGPVRNWIECARRARGTLSKILWSDDLIDSEYLNRTVPLLTDPNVSFVYTSARIFKESTAWKSGAVHYDHLPTGSYDTRLFIEGSLLGNRFPVSPGCFLLRTEDLLKNLIADIPNAIGSDFKSHAIGNDLLLLLLTACDYERFGVVNEPLSMFRDHPGSISTSSGIERLIIHYDIAKAYFVWRCKIDKPLRRRFNTMLWLHRQKHGGESFGIRRLQNFYPDAADTRISFSYLLQWTLRRMLRFNWPQLKPTVHADYATGPFHTQKLEGGRRLGLPAPDGRDVELTIITVAFNARAALEDSVESVRALSRPDVSYIVIDGGSNDGTVEFLQSCCDTIDYWLSEPDRGIYNAMNKALQFAAQGSYVLFLGAGDRILRVPDPETMAEARRSLAQMLFGDVRIGARLFRSSFSAKLQYRNTLHHQGLWIRKGALEEPWFDETLNVYSDWDLNLRLFQRQVSAKRLYHEVAYAEPDGISAKPHLAEIGRMLLKRCGPLRALAAVVYHGGLHLVRRHDSLPASIRK